VETSSSQRPVPPRSNAGRLSLASHRTPRTSAALSRLHARLFKATGGRAIGRWFGMPVVIVETVGRRSGKVRRTPVIYLERGQDIVVIAANGGSDRVPAWWLNMRDAGRAIVTLHGKSWSVAPRVATGAERDELWAEFARGYPTLDEYPTFTDRELPVVVLSR
jgi:deazaflavin-dependent oxidoreductase (nitroreductase family)